jgi:hypothetical protein
MKSQAEEERLQAYHDGELGGLARWRLTRRLARDERARRELDELARVSSLVREALPEAESPDVWTALSGRLRSIDLERTGAGDAVQEPASRGWLRPLTAGAVLAAAAAAIFVFLAPPERAEAGVVRWLETEGQPVMVLEGAEGATIIWLMASGSEQARGQGVGNARM